MLAVNSGALRRQSLWGPVAPLVQGSGGLRALGNCMTIGPASGLVAVPPPGPVELEPPLPVELPEPLLPEPVVDPPPPSIFPRPAQPTANRAALPAARSERRCIRPPGGTNNYREART